MSIYHIHEDNIERLEDKLRKIEKKCEKLGCTYNYHRLGEVYKEVETSNGSVERCRFIEVEVSGKALINGWEVIARVDHEDAGVIISKICFDVELPVKYTLSDYNHCEHCNSRRNRKVVYALRNAETQEWKQVGASCLKEFTNGLDAESAARYLSMFDELVEFDSVVPSAGHKRYYDLSEYLRYCVECVKKFGWTSSGNGYSTSERAWDFYMLKEYDRCFSLELRTQLEEDMAQVNFDANTSDNILKVESILEYINAQEADSDYLLTLKTLAANKYFRDRFTGFAASMVRCYDRHIEELEKAEAAKRAAEKSTHVGQIGDRITIELTSVECVSSWDTVYGMTFLYKLVDTFGNILMWKTGNWLDLDNSAPTKVTCTIKAHNEFRGALQTEVTRCKFVN